jgi:hypothetical protein
VKIGGALADEGGKHQAPSTKLQRNIKHQAPKGRYGGSGTLHGANEISVRIKEKHTERELWCLELDVSLVLGAWCLVLGAFAAGDGASGETGHVRDGS